MQVGELIYLLSFCESMTNTRVKILVDGKRSKVIDKVLVKKIKTSSGNIRYEYCLVPERKKKGEK